MSDFIKQQTKLFNPKLINDIKATQRQRAKTFGLTERPSQVVNSNLGYNAASGKFIMSDAKGGVGKLAVPLKGKALPYGYGSNPLSDSNTVKF